MALFSKPMTNSQIQTIALGSVAAVSILGLLYYMTSSSTTSDQVEEIEDDEAVEETDEEEEEEEEQSTTVTPSATRTEAPKKMVVEDVEEEDEAKKDAEEAARLKEKYDQLVGVAIKYAKGEKYAQAIEKYSEALALIPFVPGAKKDLASIYNNRSAMFERDKQFDKSLDDISELLKIDTTHSKARGRRCRIFEAQGKLRDALQEYGFIVAFLQQKLQAMSMQAQYAPPSQAIQAAAEAAQNEIQTSASKMEDIAKALAQQRSGACLDQLKNATSARPLPGKSYCKNFLETFASYYVWKSMHTVRDQETTDKYVSELSDIEAALDQYDPAIHIKSAYKLATYYLVDGQYTRAFNLVAKAITHWEQKCSISVADVDAICSTVKPAGYMYELSMLIDLQGVATHLKCNVTKAIYYYNITAALTNMTLDSNDVAVNAHNSHHSEMLLKLASAYVEIGEHEKAAAAFEEIVAYIELHPQVEIDGESIIPAVDSQCWMLIHRAAFWVSRIRNASSATADNVENVKKAMSDIEQSFAIMKKSRAMDKLDGKRNVITEACYLLCLIKSIQINLHYTQQMGIPLGGGDSTNTDPYGILLGQLTNAKEIDPTHDAVAQLEMELLFYNGDFDSAMLKCDALILQEEEAAKKRTPKAERKEDEDDDTNSIAYVLKANFLSQKAFAQMQGGENPTAVVDEMEGLFLKALEMEPHSVDAMIQYANIKTLFGKPDVSSKYADMALPHARNLQEILDILQLGEMTSAQAYVLAQITPN